MNFFDIQFWQNVVSNSLATLIGVIAGIPAAFWLDRRIHQWQESNKLAAQKASLAERRNHFLRMLTETLKKNHVLLDQMEHEVPKYTIFYNVDTQLLDSTATLKYEIIDDLDLNQRIDLLRYELTHLHRKVELQLEIAYSIFKVSGGHEHYNQVRMRLVDAIIIHVRSIKQSLKELLEAIDAKLET
jgi:hypothetical protein